MKILRVDASARTSSSASRALGDQLLGELARIKDTDVTVRDVGSDALPFVTDAWVEANNTAADKRTDAHQSVLALSDALVDELAAADLLVITLPIYNFGIPASLKAWIDLIARAGLTFRYSSDGPVGLLANKRALIIVTSGGTAVGSSIDHATPYLRQALAFVGIDDISLVAADSQVRDPEDAARRARAGIASFVEKLNTPTQHGEAT